MPLQSFSLGRLLTGKPHDDDTRWMSVNKFPSKTYGSLYPPVLTKRSDEIKPFQDLVSMVRCEPGSEPDQQICWALIWRSLCLTETSDFSIQAKLGASSLCVSHFAEQDLSKLRVATHPHSLSVQLKESRTFQEFSKLYDHYKAMTGSQKRRKTSRSQAGSATTSIAASAPADHTDAGPTSASASRPEFPPSPNRTRVYALVGHITAERSSQSTKRSHGLHMEGQTDVPRAGIRIPDHTLSIRGPAVRSLPVPSSSIGPNSAKEARLAHSSDPPMGVDGSPDVNRTRNQDVKSGLATRVLRRIQSVTHFRTLAPSSALKQSAFHPGDSTDGFLPPSSSPIAGSATQCALVVGEDKAFHMTWPDYERLLRSSSPEDVPATLKARLTTGWGQAMMYIQQANEICGTWMGTLACMTRFSRIVVLDPDERTLAIEVGQGFPRAITDIPDFLGRVDHTTLAWDIERVLDAQDRSGNIVDIAAITAVRSMVMTAHQIVAFERYDLPLEPLVHPKQLKGDNKLPTWQKLWAAFSVSSSTEAGIVHASGTGDGAMMMAAAAARASLLPAVRDRYRESSSTAVWLQPDTGEDKELQAMDEQLRLGDQRKNGTSLHGHAAGKETRAVRKNPPRLARRDDKGGGSGGNGGGGGGGSGQGGGTDGGGGGGRSHHGRGGGPSPGDEGGGAGGGDNGGDHGNSQAMGSGKSRQASVQPLGAGDEPTERSELPNALESYGFAAEGGRFLSQAVPPLSRSLSSDETDVSSLISDRLAHRLHRPDRSRSDHRKRASLPDEELGSDDQDGPSDGPDLKSPERDYLRASDSDLGSRAHWEGSDPDVDFPDRFSEVSPARLTDSSEAARVDPSNEEFFLPCAVRAMEAAGWTKVAIISREEMTSLIVEAGKAILDAAAAQAKV